MFPCFITLCAEELSSVLEILLYSLPSESFASFIVVLISI